MGINDSGKVHGALGVNAHGEVLEAGRVPDCYLGLRLPASDDGGRRCAVVAPAVLLHPHCDSARRGHQPSGRQGEAHADPT